MKKYLGKIVVCATALGLLSGCSPALPDAPRPAKDERIWKKSPGETRNSNGNLVVLETGAGDASSSSRPHSRCWRLSEVDPQGTEIATTSACHLAGDAAASRIFGAVVVATSCRDSIPVRIENVAGRPVLPGNSEGIFLLSEQLAPPSLEEVVYRCSGKEDGAEPTLSVEIVE